MRDPDPLLLVLAIDEPALHDRVAALLAGVAGLSLAQPGEAADLALVPAQELQVRPGLADGAAELTPREREVLALLTDGASNKAIARMLGISVHTAKFHVGRLIAKLDASGRTDAVTHAARQGVIHL